MKKKREKPIDIYELIAKNIKIYRKNRGMTQAELAEKTEYSHEFIRRIEAPNTKKNFSLDAVSNIAYALDIEVDKLFERRKEEEEDKENSQKN